MKHALLPVLIFAILLSGCQTSAAPTATFPSPTTQEASSTSSILEQQSPQSPLTPTGIASQVPSPTPAIKLEDLPQTKLAVDQYLQAMQAAGIQQTAEQILGSLSVQEVQGKDGKRYTIAHTQDAIPLMIRAGNDSWNAATTRQLASMAGIQWGTSTTISYMQSWSPESKAVIPIATVHGNLLVLDYDLMWYNYDFPENSLRPSPTEFNFKQIDLAVEFAQQHDLSLQGQCFLVPAPKFLPSWLLDEKDPSRVLEIAKNHITTLVTRYPQITTWCVALEFDNPYVQHFWQNTFGLKDLSWLKEMFETAHVANPDAKLYYSDFDNEFGGPKADKVFQMISNLKQAGTPIDQIAFQMHINGKDFATPEARQQKIDALKAEIARYTTLGIDVILPEYDLNMHGVPGDEATRNFLQAQIEHDLMLALLESGVTSISHFGADDKLNWKQDPVNGGGPDALATNFDLNGNPKANYYADMQALLEFITETSKK